MKIPLKKLNKIRNKKKTLYFLKLNKRYKRRNLKRSTDEWADLDIGIYSTNPDSLTNNSEWSYI